MIKNTEKKVSIILLSGGLDSLTCLAIAKATMKMRNKLRLWAKT